MDYYSTQLVGLYYSLTILSFQRHFLKKKITNQSDGAKVHLVTDVLSVIGEHAKCCTVIYVLVAMDYAIPAHLSSNNGS